jgi:hypothetical protein
MENTTNPWFEVPLADYEAHMGSPAVGQLRALSDLFAEALRMSNPESVAILGIAGGNGLKRLEGTRVKRAVGVDINRDYLDEVRGRFGPITGLELYCCDLEKETLAVEPVDLVHAALVFEHAGLGRCLENAISLVALGGALSVVLQLPSTVEGEIGQSGVQSIEKLGAHFSLIDPAEMRAAIEARGWSLVHEKRVPIPAGKGLWLGVFARD